MFFSFCIFLFFCVCVCALWEGQGRIKYTHTRKRSDWNTCDGLYGEQKKGGTLKIHEKAHPFFEKSTQKKQREYLRGKSLWGISLGNISWKKKRKNRKHLKQQSFITINSIMYSLRYLIHCHLYCLSILLIHLCSSIVFVFGNLVFVLRRSLGCMGSTTRSLGWEVTLHTCVTGHSSYKQSVNLWICESVDTQRYLLTLSVSQVFPLQDLLSLPSTKLVFSSSTAVHKPQLSSQHSPIDRIWHFQWWQLWALPGFTDS